MVGEPDLWVNVKLVDTLTNTSIDYLTSVFVAAQAITEIDPKTVITEVVPLADPYLEPVPEPAYFFSQTDDVFIELGEAIDPQGFEVDVDVRLGSAKEFL